MVRPNQPERPRCDGSGKPGVGMLGSPVLWCPRCHRIRHATPSGMMREHLR